MSVRGLCTIFALALTVLSASKSGAESFSPDPFQGSAPIPVQPPSFGPWTINPVTTMAFGDHDWSISSREHVTFRPIFAFQQDAAGDKNTITGGRVIFALPNGWYLATQASHSSHYGSERMNSRHSMGTALEYDFGPHSSIRSDGLNFEFSFRW